MSTELTDRFTIKFKSPMDEDHVREVFSKLARAEKLGIAWTAGRSYTEDSRPEILGTSESLLQKASGIISDSTGKRFVAIPFTLQTTDVENFPMYTSIKFDGSPSYELAKQDPKNVKAVDGIREYFKSNYPWAE